MANKTAYDILKKLIDNNMGKTRMFDIPAHITRPEDRRIYCHTVSYQEATKEAFEKIVKDLPIYDDILKFIGAMMEKHETTEDVIMNAMSDYLDMMEK